MPHSAQSSTPGRAAKAVWKLDAANSSSGSWDATCQEKPTTHPKNKTRIIRGSANTAYVHRAHQIYYYITLNELQIVDQQISLTQCISHSLEKYTLCVLLTLSEKILHLYFSCSLEGTLSLVFPLSLHSLEEALFFLQVVLFYLCWDNLQGMEAWLFIASRCPTSSFN
jgi:hypothetical protein